uniref:Putative secreted protein n=1 Tax=Anopheles darlingi TaxID=43151 RepID=A0A2M4DKT1_ANODA
MPPPTVPLLLALLLLPLAPAAQLFRLILLLVSLILFVLLFSSVDEDEDDDEEEEDEDDDEDEDEDEDANNTGPPLLPPMLLTNCCTPPDDARSSVVPSSVTALLLCTFLPLSSLLPLSASVRFSVIVAKSDTSIEVLLLICDRSGILLPRSLSDECTITDTSCFPPPPLRWLLFWFCPPLPHVTTTEDDRSLLLPPLPTVARSERAEDSTFSVITSTACFHDRLSAEVACSVEATDEDARVSVASGRLGVELDFRLVSTLSDFS